MPASAAHHAARLVAESLGAHIMTMTVDEIRSELQELSDPKVLAANTKRGDLHGVNLAQLRALAKRAKTDHERSRDLWATGDTASRLVALLTCTPKKLTVDELDALLRSTRGPKETEWLESYVIKKSPHGDELRARWSKDPDPHVEASAWKLLNQRIGQEAAGGIDGDRIDCDAVLDEIEARMADASPRLQWAMNEVLAQIGILHAEHRARAVAIGEALQVLADYPVARGCVSPYAPVWIAEMTRRAEAR